MPKARGLAGAQGGLAGALNAALKDRGGLWFGWSGQESEDRTGNMNLQRNEGVTTATIDLSTRDIDEYYNGYANSTLWPLFHYRIDLTEYENETGRGYERVNDRFADSVMPLIEDDDVVWVHDYHLIPLGERMRKRGAKNRIGFFLHIPWPPTRLLTSLPFHDRLVRTLLDYDLIGFQTEEWLSSFVHYCENELGASVDHETGRIEHEGRTVIARAYPIGIDWEHFQELGASVDHETGRIEHEGRTVIARAYPIGIDWEHFKELGASDEAKAAEERFLASTRNRVGMIGVDRLDYSKGLPERIDGIGRFYDQNPERTRDLIFIQIAPPSREDVDSYQHIREVLEQKTGQINGARSEVDIVPIRYVNRGYSHAELYGFFRAAKIGLVTPLRDGMNLVAKEYVAAQDPQDPGVLILSEFAGAAYQLGADGQGAVMVNPHSPDALARAIQTALDMPLDERKNRYEAMIATVRDDNVRTWTTDFCADLAAG